MQMVSLDERVKLIIKHFESEILIKTELIYKNDYELLISVVLSAQCTDKRVNLIAPKLYSKYCDFKSLGHAEYNDVFEIIRTISYSREKAKRIIRIARIIDEDYGSRIPNDFFKLVEIYGIGRKTANLVLSILYGYKGIAVDTHVLRVANRLGLVESKNSNIVEKRLMSLFPEEFYNKINPWFVIFGRYRCKSINPNCKGCGLLEICRYRNMYEYKY